MCTPHTQWCRGHLRAGLWCSRASYLLPESSTSTSWSVAGDISSPFLWSLLRGYFCQSGVGVEMALTDDQTMGLHAAADWALDVVFADVSQHITCVISRAGTPHKQCHSPTRTVTCHPQASLWDVLGLAARCGSSLIRFAQGLRGVFVV